MFKNCFNTEVHALQLLQRGIQALGQGFPQAFHGTEVLEVQLAAGTLRKMKKLGIQAGRAIGIVKEQSHLPLGMTHCALRAGVVVDMSQADRVIGQCMAVITVWMKRSPTVLTRGTGAESGTTKTGKRIIHEIKTVSGTTLDGKAMEEGVEVTHGPAGRYLSQNIVEVSTGLQPLPCSVNRDQTGQVARRTWFHRAPHFPLQVCFME